jgi:hypothetical protein
VWPPYERLTECARESCVMVAPRDALLPKLISGKFAGEGC